MILAGPRTIAKRIVLSMRHAIKICRIQAMKLLSKNCALPASSRRCNTICIRSRISSIGASALRAASRLPRSITSKAPTMLVSTASACRKILRLWHKRRDGLVRRDRSRLAELRGNAGLRPPSRLVRCAPVCSWRRGIALSPPPRPHEVPFHQRNGLATAMPAQAVGPPLGSHGKGALIGHKVSSWLLSQTRQGYLAAARLAERLKAMSKLKLSIRNRQLRPGAPAVRRGGADRRGRSGLYDTAAGGDFLSRLSHHGFRYLRIVDVELHRQDGAGHQPLCRRAGVRVARIPAQFDLCARRGCAA